MAWFQERSTDKNDKHILNAEQQESPVKFPKKADHNPQRLQFCQA